MIAGADGYRGQWVVATDDGDGRTSLSLVLDLSAFIARPDLEVLVIDVPIGLHERGRRGCDVETRRLIGPRRNSVFTAPIRPMLRAATWEEACAIRFEIEGKRCSRQAFGILPLIREVDRLMTPALQNRVREGHPEASFTIMTGTPMLHYKGKPQGRADRLAALRSHFPDLPEQIDAFGRAGAITDALDAYALLWTARRIRNGEALSLPSRPEIDPRGLRAEIVV